MSIDCDCFQVSNPFTRKNILKYKSKQCDGWFVFCFFKIIVCKDDVFLALKATNVKNFVPGCTGQLRQMGLIVVTIKHWVIVLQQPI